MAISELPAPIQEFIDATNAGVTGVEADIAEQLTGEGLVQPRDTEDRMTHRADTGDGPFR